MAAFIGPNDKDLPPAVRRMAKPLRQQWVDVFNGAGSDDEKAAYRAAWKAVRASLAHKEQDEPPGINQVWAGQEPAQEAIMPWKVVEEDGQHCVYQMNDDGSLAGKMKCYPDRKDALAYQAALYANVEEKAADTDRDDFLGRLRAVYGDEAVKAWKDGEAGGEAVEKRRFDESMVERHPEGDPRGGQFAPKDGAGDGATVHRDEGYSGYSKLPQKAAEALQAARDGKDLSGYSEEDLRIAYLDVSLKGEDDVAARLAAAHKRASGKDPYMAPDPKRPTDLEGVAIPPNLDTLSDRQTTKLVKDLAKLPLRKLRKLQSRVQADLKSAMEASESARVTQFDLLDRIVIAAIDRRVFGEKSADTPTLVSFKAFDQPDGKTRWVLISSGGFEDRDKEVVSTEFLRSAVAVADKSRQRGPLLIFHIPGAKIGECDYQAVVGEPGFLLESGTFDDSEAGRRAASYYKAHAKETGASIKFLYANRSPDGVYTPPGAILERSLMRRERAAFPWSALQLSEVSKMAKISQEKREELEAVLGTDLAVTILDQLDSNAEMLKQAGVRAKASAKPEDGEDEKEETTEAATPEDEAPVEEVVPADEEDDEEDMEKAAKAPSLDGGEYELVLTEDALNAVAEKAAGAIQGQLDQIAAALKAALDDVKSLRTVVEKNAQDVQAMKQSDEAKVAEKVANLPRATVRRLQAGDEYRATQSKEAVEAKAGDDPMADDWLARLKRVVHE